MSINLDKKPPLGPAFQEVEARPPRPCGLYDIDRIDFELKMKNCGDPKAAITAFIDGEARPGVVAHVKIHVTGVTLKDLGTRMEFVTKGFRA